MPITKHNVVVSRAEDIARTVREAFEVIANTGRPGPVLVHITKMRNKLPLIRFGGSWRQSFRRNALRSNHDQAELIAPLNRSTRRSRSRSRSRSSSRSRPFLLPLPLPLQLPLPPPAPAPAPAPSSRLPLQLPLPLQLCLLVQLLTQSFLLAMPYDYFILPKDSIIPICTYQYLWGSFCDLSPFISENAPFHKR